MIQETPDSPNFDNNRGKTTEDDNGEYQEPDKTVNVIFSGLPTKRKQKLTLQEIMSIEPVVPIPLKWSEVPITFSREDQ